LEELVSNVIVELVREMRRVESLYPSLSGDRLQSAQRTVYYANMSMQANSLESMQESLDDLREIKEEPKR
jgi:hypothetical protein